MGAPRLAHSRLSDRQKKAFISLLLIMPVLLNFLHQEPILTLPPVFWVHRDSACSHTPRPCYNPD
jgi:hypothetical protein